MKLFDIFYSYIHYLIHPVKTHEYLMNGHTDEFKPVRFSVYESLSISWVFIVLNALFRIVLINYFLLTFVDLMNDDLPFISDVIAISEFPSFYLVIFSAILDVIFYPLFGIFIIQFWEFIIKVYARLLDTEGDIVKKSHDILAVSLSSNILKIVPIVGAPSQSLANLILMYTGLRVQLDASPSLCVCILLTPMLLIIGLIFFFTVIFLALLS